METGFTKVGYVIYTNYGIYSPKDSSSSWCSGQVVAGPMLASSCGLALSLSHLFCRPAQDLAMSGCTTFLITAAIANRSRVLDGALSFSTNGVPGLIMGKIGHCHFSDGAGPRGKYPSPILNPGKPANRLSGKSLSSSTAAGKRRMQYLQMTPRLPEEELEICQTIRRANSPQPSSARAPRIGALLRS